MGLFSSEFFVSLETLGQTHLGLAWPVVYNLLKIMLIVVPILGAVAYLTLWERKLIGWMHVRLGPNRVGPLGLLQPIADSLKLLTKELIVPTQASKGLYLIAPVMTIMPALAAWAVIPFGPDVVLANINAGLLFLLAITSLEVYGVILAGWASNSKYAFLGAMRASAQMVSYELAIGFAMVVVLMVSGSLNLTEIVLGQQKGSSTRPVCTSCPGTGYRFYPFSSSILFLPLPKPTGIPLMWWRASLKLLQATWWSTRACRLPSSFWPSTPT